MNYSRIPFLIFLIFLIVSCSSPDPEKNNTATSVTADTTQKVSKDSVKTQSVKNDVLYKSYCNDKYNYCVEYPADYLIPQGESASQDGQSFISSDSASKLSVYRDFRDMAAIDEDFSLQQAFKEDLKDISSREGYRVTYKKSGKLFYVISGYNRNKIFYKKSILAEDGLKTCLLEYNESGKEIYNLVSERVFKSFK